MVKILGVLAILYVYYCEINAESQVLDFWQGPTSSTTKQNARRTPAFKQQNRTAATPKFWNQQPDKFTKGLQAVFSVKHYPKNAPPHIEILRNRQDIIDSDSSIDANKYKDKNKKHNPGKSHSKDKERHSNKKTEEKKTPNANKYHDVDRTSNVNKNNDIQRNGIRNRDQSSETVKDKDKSVKNKDHNKDKSRNKESSKIHNVEKTKHEEKNHVKNKNQNKGKAHDSDSDKEEDDRHAAHKKSQKRDRGREQKEKNRAKDARIGGPIKIPKLHPEPNQGRILEHKLPAHHNSRSRLRTPKGDDDAHLRSTRLTPMYLMQQDADEDRVTSAPKKVDLDAVDTRSQLSPYAIKSQMSAERLMHKFTNANITQEVVGRTVEYNDIILLKITEKKSDAGKYFRAEESKYIDEVPEKKIIFIVHGLSVMGMSRLNALSHEPSLHKLLEYYFKHLDVFDIFLIPMANPDGYIASNSNYLWNKNMSPQEACPGVCLDRNFEVAWNSSRKISSCSRLYPGPIPFSEIESKAVRDVFHYHGHKILAYIHVHPGTYSAAVFKGDAILYPRGYTESQSDDDKYIDLKGEIDEAMKNASFQVLSVTVDTLYNWYGKVSGTSVDYASTVYGIPYALEFVMQDYEGSHNDEVSTDWYALTEIWSRLIYTSFNNMYKSLHGNEVKKK